jgi:nucleotide-binding universal stress UspA family protein
MSVIPGALGLTGGHCDPPGSSTVAGTVVVCAERSPAGMRALKWAAAEARRQGSPLTVVPADPHRARRVRRSVFADALAVVSAAVPGLPVLGGASGESLPAMLRRLTAGAAALVVPATLPELTTVVAGAYCPVVVVPARDPAPEAVRGPVVLGAAPWTTDEVIALAFQAASEYKAPLRAVRVWSEPPVDLGWPRPEWDGAGERARRELESALSAWTIAHPEVPVEMVVVEDRPADILVAVSYCSRLLVVGRSARGALLAGVAGSPVDDLLRLACCPVLVVPDDGLPRARWLPTASRARALAGF